MYASITSPLQAFVCARARACATSCGRARLCLLLRAHSQHKVGSATDKPLCTPWECMFACHFVLFARVPSSVRAHARVLALMIASDGPLL